MKKGLKSEFAAIMEEAWQLDELYEDEVGEMKAYRNTDLYESRLTNKLLKKIAQISSDERTVRTDRMLLLGPTPQGKNEVRQEAELIIKQRLLDELENRGAIKDLEVTEEKIRDKHSMGYLEVTVASFSYIPSELETELLRLAKSTSIPKRKRFGFPFTLPRGTRWEGVTFTFLSEEKIRIDVRKFAYEADFKEMGFENKTNHKPNKQWELLAGLAIKGGSISWKSRGAKEENKQRVHRLAEALRKYMHMSDDPFRPYDKSQGYGLRMTILWQSPSPRTLTSQEQHSAFAEQMEELGHNES